MSVSLRQLEYFVAVVDEGSFTTAAARLHVSQPGLSHQIQSLDVQVRLVEFRHTNDLIAAMEAGQADLAVGPTPPGWDGPVREIGAEEFVLAAAPGTQLPGTGTTVRVAD